MDEDFIARLDATWDAKWPGDIPIGWALRRYGHWVRFHSLYGSGYPESQADKGIALERHLAVLQAMHAHTAEEGLAAFSYDYGPNDLAPGPLAGFDYWRTFTDPVYIEGSLAVHVRREPWTEAAASRLLREQLASDLDYDLLLASEGLEWLYAPYYGGGDAVMLDSSRRDDLYARFTTWAAPWNHWHPITEWRGPDLRH